MRLIPGIFRYTILFALGSTIGIANAAPGSQKLASQTASVETSRDIQGNWQGIFNSQLGKLRLVLKISKAPDGALRAKCNEAFPKLRAEFKELTSKIEKQPAVFESTNLINGKREQITLSRNIFSEQIRTMLYIPIYWRWLPVLIHEANANNFGPFASIAFTNLRPLIGQLAGGMSLSVVCAEDIPFITEDEIKRDTAGTFYGDYRVRTSIKACEQWPRAKVATTFSEPVKSDAPILMISGELDPVAPPGLRRRPLGSFQTADRSRFVTPDTTFDSNVSRICPRSSCQRPL